MCCLISLAYYQTNEKVQETSNPVMDQQISELLEEVQKLRREYYNVCIVT